MSTKSLILFPFILAACQKTEQPSSNAPAATPPPKIAATQHAEAAAPAAEAGGDKAGARKMANCPCTVEGAKTEIADAADGVVVTVTGQGEAAVSEIRARAKHLAEVAPKTPADVVKHTGEGEGGGGLGNCPIVLADTTLTMEEVPGGAKLVVKPGKPEDLATLRAVVKDRHSKLAAPK